MKKLFGYAFLLLVFCANSLKASNPPNDSQCSPDTLGVLPAASPCPIGGLGASITKNDSTNHCVPDSTTPYIASCLPATGLPLKDLWYSFTASENHIELSIVGVGSTTPLTDPYVAIYEYHGDCMTLIPRNCYIGSGSGFQSFHFDGFTAGVKYYLQVGSATHHDGYFHFTIWNERVCSDCMRNSFLNAVPGPVSAAYAPDTTVNICYTVVGYDQQFGNRLHGIVPLFGNGWDLTSFVILQNADSADHLGQWKWFNNITVDSVSYNGWFYDVGNDGNPTNNRGDNGGLTTSWTFCFKIKTKTLAACQSGQTDLTIKFLSFADGESGSLITTYDCTGDPAYLFQPHLNPNCCPKPILTNFVQSACYSPGSGSVTVQGAGSSPGVGWTYTLFNSLGGQVNTFTSTAPVTFNSLVPDVYTLFVKNNTTECYSNESFRIRGPIREHLIQSAVSCGASNCNDTARIVLEPGSAVALTIIWNSLQTNSLNSPGLCPGWNYVTMTDSLGCSLRDSIFLLNLPAAFPQFSYASTSYCSSADSAVVTSFPVTAGGSFFLQTSPPGMTINSSTGEVKFNSMSGMVHVKYQAPPPCNTAYVDSFNVMLSPPQPTGYPPTTLACVGQSLNFPNSGTDSIYWYAGTSTTGTPIGRQGPAQGFNPFSSSTPSTGVYHFTLVAHVASSSCPGQPLTITITEAPSAGLNLGPDITICPGFTAHLNAGGTGTYFWTPTTGLNDPTIGNPSANPDSTITYVCSVTETSGCTATDSITVFVVANPNCSIHPYGGITPNADGKNDIWYIDGIEAFKTNDVNIFNRWGSKVWSGHNYDNRSVVWKGLDSNGAQLPDGTYYYVISTGGTSSKGWVELTR